MNDADVERMIETFEAGIAGRPDYAQRLVGLAVLVAEKKAKMRAFVLARKALALAPGDPEVAVQAGKLLASLVPGYHVRMMNDVRRNKAWDAALRRAVKPGMLVFEIGTGAGMLALMAARAGAQNVVTCERDPSVAQMARELAIANGYGDSIEVVAKRSKDMELGADLPRKADIMICDIFGDDLFDFDPLVAMSDARRRLLIDGAPNVPARGGLRIALAARRRYAVCDHIDTACGFDLSPFAPFAHRASRLHIGDGDLELHSEPATALSFDFTRSSYSGIGETEAVLAAAHDCEINGIARWIRLDLDAQTALEARPEPGAEFFSSPIFMPFAQPLQLRAGEKLRIATRHQGKRVLNWLVGRG